jgi:hypothetical protein
VSPDRKPPRFDGDERDTLVRLIRFQRESLLRKLDGLSDADASRQFVGSETSLLWLVDHLARAERTWVLERFAGEAHAVVPPSTDLLDAAASYRSTSERVDEVIAAADLSAHCVDAEYVDTPLRWVVAHLLEETARHAGHADIIREMIDGSTGR